MAKRIFTSLGVTMLSLIAFFSVYLLTVTIITLLTALLSQIPILKWFVHWFYASKAQPAVLTVIVLSFIAACVLVKLIIDKLIHDYAATQLTYRLYGIALALLGIVFLVTNIIIEASIIADIGIVVIGIYYLFKSFCK